MKHVLIAIVCCAAIAACGDYHDNIKRIKARAPAIIAEIERQKVGGLYPIGSSENVRDMLQRCDPPGEYVAAPDRRSFVLHFGKYHEDSFEASWYSEDQRWSIDS